ncbi:MULTISPECIES: hypothetical protein [unclassified Bradyrhizobium]|uniref:hypothetical protein n=1 Tax=unclassified Bradyrhizobium TaxID=2631580 RepID=UPI0028E67403|nr:MULTISPECIES: hypothetical protein [unclassified Bradyrhizobium]
MTSIRIIEFGFDGELADEFIQFSWEIYAHDSNWNPPNRETIRYQLSKDYPFYRHGRSRNYIALDEHGNPCGRISAIINDYLVVADEKIGHIGFFECVNRSDVAAKLLDHAGRFLRENGVTAIWGPLNFSTLYSYRLLKSGHARPPFYTDIYNPSYYSALLEQYGYREIRSYSSEVGYRHDQVVAGYKPIRDRVRKAGFSFRCLDPSKFDEELALLYELVTDIFGNNFAASQIDPDEFNIIYGPYRNLLKPDHLRFAYGPAGDAIGFFLAVPDFSGKYEGAYIAKMLGVRAGFRRYGIPAALVHDTLSYFIESGYTSCIASLRIDENPSTHYGAGWYHELKRYALYEYRLR